MFKGYRELAEYAFFLQEDRRLPLSQILELLHCPIGEGEGPKEEGGGLLTPCSAIGLVTLLLHVGMLLVQVWLGWRRWEAVGEVI